MPQPMGDRDTERAAPGAFLAAARRRYRLRSLLAIAAGSGACGLLYTFGSRFLLQRYRIELPGFSVGLALFVVLAVGGFRGARLGRVAREADRRLGLQDRLATFLDFGARADVAPEFRAAQAREAAAALCGVDAARAIALPRLLWAGPLLLGWLLYVDFFEFFTPFDLALFSGPGRKVVQRRAADGGGDAPSGGESPAPGAPAPPRDAGPTAPDAPPDRGDAPPEPEATADADAPAGEDAARESGDAPSGAPGAPVVLNEPPQLFSEPVSRELTPVDDATGGGGPPGAGLDLPPRGRISFDIVPTEGAGEGPGGAGGPGSGTAGGLRITIDYDAVPAEYRVQVRRYFNALVRLFQGGTDGA